MTDTNKLVLRKSAIERTLEAMKGNWAGNNAKLANAKSFLARCKKRDKKAKLERASRKRNRR